MKAWKKETLKSAGIGAAILAVVTGVLIASGASFGPCGPGDVGAVLLLVAHMPGLALTSMIVPSGEEFAWLAPVVFIPANVLLYAIPVWLLRRALARRANSSYDARS